MNLIQYVALVYIVVGMLIGTTAVILMEETPVPVYVECERGEEHVEGIT